MSALQVSDRIVYTRHLSAAVPPPGARNVRPSSGGDFTAFELDEHGQVVEARPDGLILVRMDSGEQRLLAGSDPSLRKAGLIDQLLRLKLFHRAS